MNNNEDQAETSQCYLVSDLVTTVEMNSSDKLNHAQLTLVISNTDISNCPLTSKHIHEVWT